MNKILIIGLGLIGGSFAKALRQHKIAREIWAFDTNIATINSAKTSGTIDGFAVIDDNIKSFDLVVIATPLSSYKDIFQKLSAINPQNTVIIDLGSLKEFALTTLPENLKQNFVACHPIAGSDKTGFENASATLFLDKKFVICKGKTTAEKSVKIVENLAHKIGGKPDFIDAKLHDEIYALISHLPQFLSFLTREFSPEKQENDFIKTAFRLDNSSAEIWEDIFKINRKNLQKFYLEFFDNLTNFATMIRKKEYTKLLTELKNIQPTTNIDHDFAKIMDAKIIFRLIIVASYLKIKKINSLNIYAGSGFRDFTSIILLLKSEKNFLQFLEREQKEVLSFIRKIST